MLMTPPPQGNVTANNRQAFSPTQSNPGLQQPWGGQGGPPGFNQLTPGMQNLGGSQSAQAMNLNSQFNQAAKALGFRN